MQHAAMISWNNHRKVDLLHGGILDMHVRVVMQLS